MAARCKKIVEADRAKAREPELPPLSYSCQRCQYGYVTEDRAICNAFQNDRLAKWIDANNKRQDILDLSSFSLRPEDIRRVIMVVQSYYNNCEYKIGTCDDMLPLDEL